MQKPILRGGKTLLLAGAFLLFAAFSAPLPAAAATSAQDPLSLLQSLPSFKDVNVAEEYRFVRELGVAYGKVYRFRRVSGGNDVAGSDVAIAIGKEGEILSYRGEYRAESGASAEEGRDLFCFPAEMDIQGEMMKADLDYVPNEARPETGTYYLADYGRNLFVYRDSTARRLYSSALADGFDEAAAALFCGVTKAYDFYTAENIGADRRGIDGANDEVWGNADERGEIPIYLYPHYNAYGNRQNASFGFNEEENVANIVVGDGDETGPLLEQWKALDILAHEYQHGVTMFTAELGHENQAGALNESISDIFGALIEGHDPSEDAFWDMGERGVPAGVPCVRSIRSPSSEYPVAVEDAYPECHREGSHSEHGNCDAGGVHFNSIIATNMQYRLYKRMPASFTRENIGKLWYATLCMLPSDASFLDFGREFMQAAINLRLDFGTQTAIREELCASGLLSEKDVLHTVTFCGEDGRETKTFAFDGAPLPLSAPDAREGFLFEGWFLDADCTQRAEGTATGDTSLYAKWTALPEGEGPGGGENPSEGETPGEGGEGGNPEEPAAEKKGLPAWKIGVICGGVIGGAIAGMGIASFVILRKKRNGKKKDRAEDE